MLRALQPVRRPGGQLRSPLILLQWKGQSGVGLPRASSNLEKLLVVKSKEALADRIENNPHALAIYQKMELMGRTSLMVRACRFILGNRLSKTGMKLAVEKAEAAKEAHQEQMMHLVRAYGELRQVVIELRKLEKQMEEEMKVQRSEISFIKSSINCIFDGSKEDMQEVRRFEKKKRNIQDLLELDFPNGDMPRREIIEKACKEAENVCKDMVQASLPDSARQRVEEADRVWQAEKDCHQEKVKEMNKIRANLYQAQAGVEALRTQEEDLNTNEAAAKSDLEKRKEQLKEIEKRLRDYTYQKWGWRVEMWTRDVDLAETEKAEKLKQIEECEARIKKIQDDRTKLTATADGEKAIMAADCKKIEDELKVAEQEEAEAKERVQESAKKLKDTWHQIGKECEELGASNLEEAEKVKFMATMIEADIVVGRQLEESAPGDTPHKRVQKKIDRLLEDIKQQHP